MRIKKPVKELDLQELRDEIVEIKKEGEKIISHFNKMQEYYSDWEDRLLKIEYAILEAEEQHGLTREEVVEYNALDDI